MDYFSISSPLSPLSPLSSSDLLSPLSTLSVNHNSPNLNNLPLELYHFYLFEFLNLDDIWELRLISKWFYSVVKTYEIKELYLHYDRKSVFKCNWFTTKKPMNIRADLTRYGSLLENPSNNVLNLKYLNFDLFQDYELNILNKFTKLEILEAYGEFPSVDDLLQLPDLKVLSLYYCVRTEKPGRLTIDTPNLHSLAITLHLYDHFTDDPINDLVMFKHSHSIQYLKLEHYDKIASTFSNLTFLELRFISSVNSLLDLKNLKKIRIDKISYYAISNELDLGELNELQALFRSKRKDLEMVVAGVRIKEEEKLNEIEAVSDLKFQMNNYEELDNDLDYFSDIDFHTLINIKVDLPSDLFEKYTCISSLTVSGEVQNENQLINFISNCRVLAGLHVETSLSSTFYHQLPLFSSLTILIIEDLNSSLNYDFMRRMTSLVQFEIYENILTGKHPILNNLKNLTNFKLYIKGQLIEVIKENKDEYIVFKCSEKSEHISINRVLGNRKKLNLPCKKSFNEKELTKWLKLLTRSANLVKD